MPLSSLSKSLIDTLADKPQQERKYNR